jgi:general stress protein 26
MNSINRNQPEHNREDIGGQRAVDRIKEVVDTNGTCFFCTTDAAGDPNARPMSVRKVDEVGRLWFLSARDSHTNEELTRDPSARLYFQGSKHSDFLALTGTATITTDAAIIKDLWNPVIKTWFTGGVDDPRITAVMFQPATGYYWDNKHGDAIAGIKMLVGAAIGKTLDDSIEGRVRL